MIRTFLLLTALLVPDHLWAQDIRVEDAYARTSLRSGAVYLRIANTGAAADRLLAASTVVAARAMLHTNEVTDNVAAMRPLSEGLEVAAGSNVALVQGGTHIMLMGLSEKLTQGSRFELLLTFEKSGEIVVEVRVDNKTAAEAP